MDETQAVATTDTPSTTGNEDGGAQEPSVEELLAQFDQSQPETKAAPIDKSQLEEVIDFVKQQSQQEQQSRTQKDIESAVKTVVGDSDLDADYVDAALWRKANKDPAFLNAFQQRTKAPEQWGQVLRALGKEMRAGQSKPDPNTTTDREAVAAAVRGSSTKTPADKPLTRKALKGMSDFEFGKLVKEAGST